MARFYTLVSDDSEAQALTHSMGVPVFHHPPCAFGLLADEGPKVLAGPFIYQDLAAVGEVTLFNRAKLLAQLPRPARRLLIPPLTAKCC